MESDQTEYYEVEGIDFDGKPKKFLYPKPKKKETEDNNDEVPSLPKQEHR